MKYLLMLAMCGSSMLQAQNTDTLHVGQPLKAFNKLKYETYNYEVYSEQEGKKSPSIQMSSTVKRHKVEDEEVVLIEHHWESTYGNGGFYALVEPQTLKPIVQIRKTQRNGTEGYRFDEGQIVGLDTLDTNQAADFHLQLPYQVFNFEIDLETFACLPLKSKAQFVIPFLHVGGALPPQYYQLRVDREEKLEVDALGEVDTWVLFMDYGGTQPTYFWYTKEDHAFVKMEAEYKGNKIFKIRHF